MIARLAPCVYLAAPRLGGANEAEAPRFREAADKPAPRVVEKGPLKGAYISPHDSRVVVLPPDKPLKKDPVSGSAAARGAIAGTIAGAFSGTYVSIMMLGAHPSAAVGVVLGCTVLGGVVGYLASK